MYTSMHKNNHSIETKSQQLLSQDGWNIGIFPYYSFLYFQQ